MAWHLQIGFDEGIMKKVDEKDKTRQKFIFSMLTIMIMFTSLIVLASSIVYLLIVFHNWIIAISAGLFLSLVVFNLYRLLIITAINAEKSGIGEHLIHHEKQYEDFIDNQKADEITKYPPETILKIVNDRKDELRPKFDEHFPDKFKIQTSLLSMTMRVFMLSVIALVFSTGIELIIFKSQVNEVLDITATKLSQEVPDSWVLKNTLKPEKGKEFIMFHCNSLLLIIDVLETGLGKWKLVLDLLFLAIFLLPLILIFKSKEIQKGDYVRELALHEISISCYSYLITQKHCASILKQIREEDLLVRFRNKANGV